MTTADESVKRGIVGFRCARGHELTYQIPSDPSLREVMNLQIKEKRSLYAKTGCDANVNGKRCGADVKEISL